MSDEGRRRPPLPPRRVSSGDDDEVVFIPPGPDTERSGARKNPEAVSRLVKTPAEMTREVLDVQRKMALQLDGFGQTMNRRFELFHQELAIQRADASEARAILDRVHAVVTSDHEPRIGKVEATMGQKAAKGGGIVAIILLVAPLLAEQLPKYKGLIEAIAGAFQ